MTKSVDLIKNEKFNKQTISFMQKRPSHNQTATQLGTIKHKIPKFKEDDTLSGLSGEDEWNEIEKYNAMAEKHDKQMRNLSIQKNKQRLQECRVC